MDITKEYSQFKEYAPKERTQFIKKNKWILKADHLTEHFQKSVKLDVFNQEIVFETFAVQSEKASAQKWIKCMQDAEHDPYHEYNNETITLIHHDSKGNEIAIKNFFGLKVFGHKCYFDYEAGGDTAVDTVYVKYEKEVELTCVSDTSGKKQWMPKISHFDTKDIKYPEIYNLKTPQKEAANCRAKNFYEQCESARKKKEKTPEVKKPLNLCTRKRLP